MIRLLVFCKRALIERSGDLSSGAFGGLLVSQIHTVIREQQENDTQNESCFATNAPFNLLLRAKQTKRPSPLLLLILPVVEF